MRDPAHSTGQSTLFMHMFYLQLIFFPSASPLSRFEHKQVTTLQHLSGVSLKSSELASSHSSFYTCLHLFNTFSPCPLLLFLSHIKWLLEERPSALFPQSSIFAFMSIAFLSIIKHQLCWPLTCFPFFCIFIDISPILYQNEHFLPPPWQIPFETKPSSITSMHIMAKSTSSHPSVGTDLSHSAPVMHWFHVKTNITFQTWCYSI